MDVLVLILGFICAVAAGWMALTAEIGSFFAVLAYGGTFLVIVGCGFLLRRWREWR